MPLSSVLSPLLRREERKKNHAAIILRTLGKPLWEAYTTSMPCIGTMNPPLTSPRRGTGLTRTNACSPPGRGLGWVAA